MSANPHNHKWTETPDGEIRLWICGNCNTANEDGRTICVECGVRGFNRAMVPNAELAELRKDGERLEALKPALHRAGTVDERLDCNIGGKYWRIMHTHHRGNTGWFLFEIGSRGAYKGGDNYSEHESFGAAIDAAMEQK